MLLLATDTSTHISGGQRRELRSFKKCWAYVGGGGTVPYFPKIAYFFLTSHNFFSLSSVQIIIIPACCLLCVL